MNKKSSFWPPVAMGFVAGTIIGASMASMGSKGHSAHRLKRHAQRAAHSMGDMAEDLADWVRS